jgi:hypothetical protein
LSLTVRFPPTSYEGEVQIPKNGYVIDA